MMAIPLAKQFDYSVVVHRSVDGVWRGRAEPAPDAARHPGLAGDRPSLEFSNGVIRLRKTEGVFSLVKPFYRDWGAPASDVSFSVGRLDRVLKDGDQLRLSRGGTTDLGVVILRQHVPMVGVGAVTQGFAPTITIQEDPRVFEEHLYHLKRTLAKEQTTLVWLDVADPDLDTMVNKILSMAPGGRLVLAIAGGSEDQRRRLNNRIAGARIMPKASSSHYVDVDARFRNENEWLDYIHSLPSARPLDVYVRFTIGGAPATCENSNTWSSHHGSCTYKRYSGTASRENGPMWGSPMSQCG